MTPSVEDWVKERMENCEKMVAIAHSYDDAEGWREDLSYFTAISKALSAVRDARLTFNLLTYPS